MSSEGKNVSAEADPVYVSKCCSGQVSKALLRFVVTTFIALSLLFFAMYKLSTNVSGEEKALYYSLLSTCIAIYLPPPTPHDAMPPALGPETVSR
jgi:hypothetical protein